MIKVLVLLYYALTKKDLAVATTSSYFLMSSQRIRIGVRKCPPSQKFWLRHWEQMKQFMYICFFIYT